MQVLATAHPNIALVKYWGKQDTRRNLPAVSSVSITLDTLRVATELEFAPTADDDSLSINGALDREASRRAADCLAAFRRHIDRKTAPMRAVSTVNFPVAAGLASSAAGFAAPVVAADALTGSTLPRQELARLAGGASGSAARSLYGGFVHLAAPATSTGNIDVREVASAEDWPLTVAIAVTTRAQKPVGSTAGMELTRTTSPYYNAWVDSQQPDIDAALAAISQRDFAHLAEVSESSCLKMHGLMLSANPGLVYWNAATIELVHRIRELRQQGVAVFFTIDAGPQVKAVCEPADRDAVVAALADVPGVLDVLTAGLGPGAAAAPC